MSSSAVSAGFVPLQSEDPFEVDVGPLYCRTHGQDVEVGFVVARHHLGPNGCHGGMLCSLAKVAIGAQARHRVGAGERFELISLNTEFLRSAPLGAWVSARTEILRVTKNFIFTAAVLSVGDAAVLRASGLVGRSS